MQSVTTVSTRQLLFIFIQDKFNGLKWNSVYIKTIESAILNFSLALSKKWIKACRNNNKFNKIHTEWLDSYFKIPNQNNNNVSTSLKIGRPIKNFNECADSSKRRKNNISIANSFMTTPEIHYASQNKFSMAGQRNIVQLFKEVTSSDKASDLFKPHAKLNSSKIIPLTVDEALAFFIENDLTKHQYLNIRLTAKQHNADIYPPYDTIITAKALCYPENCIVSESFCEIKLQDLLNHTSKRIFEIPSIHFNENYLKEFEIIYKWGCDGSNGQSLYKQQYRDSNECSDSDLFLFSIVPLQLHSFNETNEKHIIWKNRRTSSTRFCRPIKFKFQKETKVTTLHEVNDIEDQIQNLLASHIIYNGKEVIVKHTLLFSMVDGKVNELYNIIYIF